MNAKYVSNRISEKEPDTVTKATLIFTLSLSRNARLNRSTKVTKVKKLMTYNLGIC